MNPPNHKKVNYNEIFKVEIMIFDTL